jgi:hypothetical protein
MIRRLGGKKIAKPTQAQITKSKPVSALPAPKPSTDTAVAKRPSTAVTTQGKAVGSRKPSSQPREMKNITPPKSGGAKRTQLKITPPKKSSKITKGDKVLAGATVAGLTAATLLPKGKGTKPATADAPTRTPTPASRPDRRKGKPDGEVIYKRKKTGMSEGNTVAGSSGRKASKGLGVGKQDKNDPRKDFKSKTVKDAALPAGAKPFKGTYNKKTQKLRNIRGKTYVLPK